MKDVIRQWMRGAIASLASMAIYAIALGCYIALMLLVISMEEGGDNLTGSTQSLTQAMVLLSEGSGFSTDSLVLTIPPLMLTVLLIWLIDAVSSRLHATDIHSYAAGLLVWLAVNEFFRHGVGSALVDAQWLVLLKAALIFTIGYGIGAIRQSPKVQALIGWARKQISPGVRRCIILGLVLAAILLLLYLLIGLVTVIVWTVRNHTAVVSVFTMSGMETGSRILTTIAMLIWVPNLMLWAVSWLFGAGFAIGDLASFTLWIGQSNGLPAVPVFGILPEPITSDLWRGIVLALPFAVSVIAGLLILFVPVGFRYRPLKMRDAKQRGAAILDLAYPAASFCIAAGLISLLSTLLFAISNGSLGRHRLAHVGVDVMASTRAVGHPTALGLATAWLIALIGTAIVFSIIWIAERIKTSRATDHTVDDTERQPRSSASQSHKPKEEQDDKHEPTDTSGTGLGLS